MTETSFPARLAGLFAPYAGEIGSAIHAAIATPLDVLSPLDGAPALLALGEATRDRAIADLAAAWMQELGYEAAPIREAREAAGFANLVGADAFWRSRTATPPAHAAPAVARPALGSTRLAIVAFAVAVAEGDAAGAATFAAQLREVGAPPEQLHALARLAAGVKAASRLP